MSTQAETNLNPRRHVAAIAYDLWLEKKGSRLSDASTLGKDNPDHFLASRLAGTFSEGWNAAERHYGHIIEQLKRQAKGK